MSSSGDNLLEQALNGDRATFGQLLEQESPALRQRLTGEIPARGQSALSADAAMPQTYIDAFLAMQWFAARNEGSFRN